MTDTKSQEWIFSELKQLDDINFRFSDYIPSYERVSSLSSVMQETYLNYSDLLTSGFISEYNTQHIMDLLNLLRPDNYLLSISSKTKPGDWNAEEYWYGSRYKVEPLSKELIQKTNNLSTNYLFKLPSPNKYIPQEFIIKSPSENRTNMPRLTYHTNILRYWYKEDDAYSDPKTYLILFFKIPGYSDTPFQEARVNVYIDMLFNDIAEIIYYADVAGHEIAITPHRLGFQLSIHGFSDKILKLLEDILDAFLNFQPTLSKYNFSKEHVKLNINTNSYRKIKSIAISLYTQIYWSSDEILNALNSFSFTDIEMFHKVRFSQVFVEALAVGVLPDNTPIFIENYIKKISNGALYPFQLLDLRSSILEKGSNYIYELDMENPDDQNSVVLYSLQIGDLTNSKLMALLDILHRITKEAVFTQLRTKEQLGYYIKSDYLKASISLSYQIMVISLRDPFYIEQRIIAFLYKLAAIIETMTNEKFKKYVDSIIAIYSMKPANIFMEHSIYWEYINSGLYYFNFDNVALNTLKNLTKDDFIDFFYEYIYPDSLNRKKLSIHLKSRTLEEVSSKDISLQKLYYYLKCNELEIPLEDLVSLVESNPKLSELEKSIQELLTRKYPNVDVSIVLEALEYLRDQYKKLKQKTIENYNATRFTDPVIFKNSLRFSSAPLPMLPWEQYMKP